MGDKRIPWLLAASVVLAGCVASEPVPLADAVPEAGPFREYIGVPPAALLADLTSVESDEVVFVTVNDDGSITLVLASGTEVLLTAETLDEGQGCVSEGSGELVCEIDDATLSVALVTSGADPGAPNPGFATHAVIGGATGTLPGGGTPEYGGPLDASMHLGGGLPNDSLSGPSPVTQMFETGIAGPAGLGALIFPGLPAVGGLYTGDNEAALFEAASQGDIRGTLRRPALD